MELPVNQLMDIISSDELNVRSEEQVFSAVMAWVKYNVTERRPYLAQVCWILTVTTSVTVSDVRCKTFWVLSQNFIQRNSIKECYMYWYPCF